MRELRLVDRRRSPPEWNEHLGDAEHAVFLSDVRTGVALAADGSPRPAGAPGVCLVFPTPGDARAFCQERTRAVEHLRCDVYDRAGKAVPPLATYVHPSQERRLPNGGRPARSCWPRAATSWPPARCSGSTGGQAGR